MATDYDCWKKGEDSVTFEMVMRRMKKNADNVKKLLIKVISKINFYKCECKNIIG